MLLAHWGNGLRLYLPALNHEWSEKNISIALCQCRQLNIKSFFSLSLEKISVKDRKMKEIACVDMLMELLSFVNKPIFLKFGSTLVSV